MSPTLIQRLLNAELVCLSAAVEASLDLFGLSLILAHATTVELEVYSNLVGSRDSPLNWLSSLVGYAYSRVSCRSLSHFSLVHYSN